MEARWYCWVTLSRWSHYHSLSLPTHQHRQLNNKATGPSDAWRTELPSRTTPRVLLSVPDALIYGVESQPVGPSMWLTSRTTEKDPRQPSPLSAWIGGPTEKAWSKRPSDCQLQEAQKKTLMVKDFIFWGSKITVMVTAAMKLKNTCSLEEKLWLT